MDTLYHSPGYVLWNNMTLPLNLAVCLIMVAAGVGLLLLKNWARRASIGCGIYKILFVFLNIAVFCSLGLRDIAARVMDAAGVVGIVILGLVGLVATVLTLVYPVLLLYFMTHGPKSFRRFSTSHPHAFESEPGEFAWNSLTEDLLAA